MLTSRPPLKSIIYRAPAEAARFPFNVPVIRTLGKLAVAAPVTSNSVACELLEHITLTRSCLNNPDAYLRHL